MAIQIYKPSELVTVQIGEVKLKLRPLKAQHRTALKMFTRQEAGEFKIDAEGMMMYALKCSIRHIDGIEYTDGTPLKAEFTEQDILTEDCLTGVYAAVATSKMVHISAQLMNIGGVMDFAGIEVTPKEKNTKKKSTSYSRKASKRSTARSAKSQT